MSLGSSLLNDIKTALSPTDNPSDFSSKLSTAVNNYLAGAIYAEGALLWVGTTTPASFIVPVGSSASDAADIIASGVQGYWGSTGIAVGTAGTATSLTSVVSGTINASTVKPTLKPLLTNIFSDLSTTLPNDDPVTIDSKSQQIADAITTSVATIITEHTETTPPVVSGTIQGGIE